MNLYTRFRARSQQRLLQATTFCDECQEVCTPEGRRESLQERMRRQSYGPPQFR